MAGKKGNTFSSDLLKLIFNGTPIANIADNAAASPLTNLYVSLHTADPTGIGELQSNGETTYGAYARVAVLRTTGGWTVAGTGPSVAPAAAITFPTPTTGNGTVLIWWGVGTAPTGTGKLLYHGPITPNITIAVGTPPILTSASTITEG